MKKEKKEVTRTTIDFKVEKENAIVKINAISEDITALVEIGMEIEVNSSESLLIANQKLSEAKELIDITEEVRKAYVREPNDFVKEVNSYAKAFIEPVSKMVTYLKEQAKAYQELEIARIRLEQEKTSKELEDKLTQDKEDLRRLSRAAVQIHARIFGGSYKTGKGEIKKTAGCITTEQCTDLRNYLAEHYPEHESFNNYKDKSRELISKFTAIIIDLQRNLELKSSANEKVAEKASKAIIKAKTDSEKFVVDEFEELGTVIIKMAEKKSKTDAKILADVSKGIRKNIVWTVTDLHKVPHDYLTIDEDKVNEFLSEHRDRIRTMIEQDLGETILKGIEFTIRTIRVNG